MQDSKIAPQITPLIPVTANLVLTIQSKNISNHCRTDDPAANFPNTDINRADSYKKLLFIFGPAVVGKTKWACTDGVSLLSSVLTVTDEAFKTNT
jgi:hypothetical protein